MQVLVVYESRYGATQGIAEQIAATLRHRGLEATLQPADHAGEPVGYNAAVIGSATYQSHWMKHATEFVRRNRTVLATRPVWLFSSGPLGPEDKDAQGRDLRVVMEPKEIAEFREAIKPKDHRVFFGALDRSALGFTDRLVLKLPANRGDALPEGDFRDWGEVAAWAISIARELKASADDSI